MSNENELTPPAGEASSNALKVSAALALVATAAVIVPTSVFASDGGSDGDPGDSGGSDSGDSSDCGCDTNE